MATKSSCAFDSVDDDSNYIVERDAATNTWNAKDEWIYPLDSKIRLNSLPTHEASSELCDRCRNINLKTRLDWLHNPENNCNLCQTLSKIRKEVRNKISLLEARQYVRICAVPESQDNSQSQDDSTRSEPIQPGLPGFLQSGSPLYFDLIKEWIRVCDARKCSGKNRCCPEPDRAWMPTRLINVGDGHTARLVLIDKYKMSRGARYIALSHCWGDLWRDLPEEKRDKWSTTPKGVQKKMEGFLVKELPQTFQDAITVTRELGLLYLWIDSLCIIQGKDGDFETEAKKMEAVFKNAYCTIAATSAEDSTKGFLNRPLEEKDSQHVTVPESSHGKVYICTSIDDFDGDVIKGPLNTRAWVLQERALSRRTIHFTKRQTYWECGGGVRCETLTHMTNAKLSFRSDPEFPRSIAARSQAAQIKLLQSLFADYSKLDLTYATDRSVAIESLAKALANAKALNTKVHYGVVECFLHRSLLWQPAQNTLTQIDYDKKEPPSWSWMAYHGQIQYLQIEFGDVEWDRRVQLDEVEPSDSTNPEDNGYVLEARVRRLRDCEIKPEGVKRIILDKENKNVGQLWFDTEPEVRCAILGREKTGAEDGKRRYYVLFVIECGTPWGRGKFRRVGMGSIEKRFILFDGQDDTAQIL